MKRGSVLCLSATVAGVWWLWPSAAPEVVGTQRAAVLADGFAVLEGAKDQVVHELDDDGHKRDTIEVEGLPADARLVGSRIGPVVVWKDGKKVALASADSLDRRERFGKNVHHLCAQTATNERRFGVAWTEQNGDLWFVHGPAAFTDAAISSVVEVAKQPDWCGIASANDQIVLLWREGERTFFNRCGKQCGRSPVRFDVKRSRAILGFGCTRDACLVVTREDRTSYASWITNNGKVAWSKPLPDACGDTTVSVAGVGAHVAIAYSLGPEPVVRVAGADGELRAVWQGGGDPDTVPSLAWSGERLLVAFEKNGALATAVLKKQLD